MLGVSQQTVAKFLSAKGDYGLSYFAATEVARLAGFDGVDAFFDAKGVRPKSTLERNAWQWREHAITLARTNGMRESAIQRVVKRFAEDRYCHATAHWWLERFRQENADESVFFVGKHAEGREQEIEAVEDEDDKGAEGAA